MPKTANYRITPHTDRPDTIFTNAGATGAVTFTLPTPNRALLGVRYEFKAVADQNLIVAAPTADTLIVLNDVAADSLAIQTSSQKVGGRIVATCVHYGSGFAWAAEGAAVGHTYTIAT